MRWWLVVLALTAPAAASAASGDKPCKADPTIQRWLTITDVYGKSVRTPLAPCDRFGNETKDESWVITEPPPPPRKCVKFGKPGIIYVREPGQLEFKERTTDVCLKYEQ